MFDEQSHHKFMDCLQEAAKDCDLEEKMELLSDVLVGLGFFDEEDLSLGYTLMPARAHLDPDFFPTIPLVTVERIKAEAKRLLEEPQSVSYRKHLEKIAEGELDLQIRIMKDGT